MANDAVEEYVDAYRRRTAAITAPSDTVIERPGLHGAVRGMGAGVSLLVSEDGARDELAALLTGRPRGVVTVLDGAERSSALLGRDPLWRASPVTLMVCRDLASVPAPPLPPTVHPRVVALTDVPGEGEIALVEAASLVVIADLTARDQSPDQMAGYLRRLRPAPCLRAAVDEQGAVRATAGFRVTGDDASVFFVNTHPGWRRQGIGRAMTALALHAARSAGATLACLNASDAGASIYHSLGFTTAASATQFSTAG